jgi:alkylation response protein AidB-like acyl-CoA dehydrogenase
MTYRAPVEDFRFVFEHIAGMPELLKLDAFSAVESDLIDAVLEENARFTEEVVAPTNWDGDQHPPTYKDGVVSVTESFKKAFRHYVEGGWQGLRHPEAWGGQGLPGLLSCATTENLYAANVAFSLCPMLTDGVIEALLLTGSDAQKQRYVAPLVEGKWTGTMNLTEPQAGSDLSMVNSRAVVQADGSYRVFGQKIYITFGEHDLAENIIHLVLARTANAPDGVKGLSLFIVPKFLVNDDGTLGARNDVWCASIEHKLGIHGSPTAVLLFGDGKGDVGEGAIGTLIGEENRGLEYMFIMMNAARFAVGVQGIGVSEAATQKATEYARDRVQSRAVEGSAGPVAIIQHPDVQRMLSTMRGLTEAARSIACIAAAADDLSLEHPDEEVRRSNHALYDYLVPVVKGFSTECALEVSSLGVQVHGGMGFIEETGAAQFYRDARILTIYEGTTAIQSNDLVGRKTIRNAGASAFALAHSMQETVEAVAQAARECSDWHQPGLQVIHDQLSKAVHAYQQAVQYVLDHAKADPRAVFAGSVPYLMLTGYVTGGWCLARAALVCVDMAVPNRNAAFMDQKFSTAVFYAAAILPRVHALGSAMQHGVVIADVLQHAHLV